VQPLAVTIFFNFKNDFVMMKIFRYALFATALALAAIQPASAQSTANCSTYSDSTYLTGRVFVNYGSVSNSFSTKSRSSVTVGQPVVGTYLGQLRKGTYGFWARFLLPPAAPVVVASEGDLEDRVQINWNPDPLSPASTGYKLYRDGALLATLDGQTFSFIDFNVIAGKFYTYEVAGLNIFGEGTKGKALGFLNPNGVVTGQIKSLNGNPVPNAMVTLTPTVGRSVSFDQNSTTFMEYSPLFPRDVFTLSCWVKIGDNNDKSAIFDFGSTLGKNWWLHTQPQGADKGIVFGVGRALGDVTEISHAFPAATANDWHNVAVTYNGSALLLYVDGELIETAVTTLNEAESVLFLGQKPDGSGKFNGKLDELRFFDVQLSQTKLQMIQGQSISSTMPGLVAYWKFDEGTGSKAFDLTPNKHTAFHCGTQWSNDKPTVINAGITDETGSYAIEGINYGAGTVFTAKPSKKFYFNQSLEFNAVNEEYAELTNFDLADSATVEVTVNAFDFANDQCILTKQDGSNMHFGLHLNAGNLVLEMGNETHDFGPLGMGYFRLAFLIDCSAGGGAAAVTFYKNGELAGTHTFSGVSADFSAGTPWTLGAGRDGANLVNYFSGLIDEVAFFSSLLPLGAVQAAANVGTDLTRSDLVNYFPLNEGSGSVLKDFGTQLSGQGAIYGAQYSTVVKIAKEEPHLFTPASRLATLNPTNTSVDAIDFTDQSTVPVSGYVRFDGTTCFQKGVEILVNGQRYSPPVFTDEDGYFSVEFEPGASAILTPVFNEHTFYPAFWEIDNIASPVAGILFRNQVKRTIRGQMAGNEYCRKSVIPDGAIVKVKVETLDGCYYKEQQLTTSNGKFVFSDLPPLKFAVAVTEHSNNIIYNYFQLQGGQETDLTDVNDTIDFIYHSAPEIEMTTLDTNLCGDQMLEQSAKYTTEIKVYQPYDGGNCYLDTFDLHIENLMADPADTPEFDTTITEGKFKYRFRAGIPNIAAPYLRTLTVLASANQLENTRSTQAVVLGKRPRAVNFTSSSPEIPMMILRDPPGDNSSATISKGTTVCNGWTLGFNSSVATGGELQLKLGTTTGITTGIGVATKLETEIENTLTYGLKTTVSNTVSNSTETCFTANETISTSSGDVIFGEDADVFVGGAMNLLFGITDDLRFDTNACSFYVDTGVVVFPDKFNTTFLYTGYQIKRTIIPNLQTVGDTASVAMWEYILDYNRQLKNQAIFEKNLSFDAGVTYESSTTSETTKTSSLSFDLTVQATYAAQMGFFINDAGVGAKFTMDLGFGASTEFTDTETNSQTVSYTLADDDIGDVFTLDVLRDLVYATPVFRTVSGNSSCPFEEKTVPRDAVTLTVDKTIVANVLENDEAVFKFNVGNVSQTDEYRYYILDLWQPTNPNGATINIQGTPNASGTFFPAPGGSDEVTLTVKRGPVAYEYENLLINAYSGCEGARYDALGNGEFPPAPFYEGIEISVYFLEPCSPIDVGFPLQNWVLTPSDGDILFITLNEFDRYDTDLELLRVQYRRKQGDGAWINITEVLKSDLANDVFHIVPWNTLGLQDGEYEIRAVTQCTGGQNAGISTIISGRIERTPPEVFGTPEPADGVLSIGDEISITFTEPIRCDLLIQADFFDNNNVGLYNSQTGDLVDAVMTCSGDKITLVPNVPNRFIENTVMRVEVDDIKDLAGNNFEHTSWEFFVDRNPLRWLGGSIASVIYEGEGLTLSREIQNIGGQALAYTIAGIPDWVEVFPKEGSLAPGASQIVNFMFKPELPRGEYLDTIMMEGALGDEPLIIHLRKLCKGPVWDLNPGAYSYSMNLTVQLDIEGTLSTDEMDRVGAFIDGQLRGWAYLQYEEDINKYVAFLTVYSNTVSGETIDFQIWDADECLLYGEVVESFTFTLDAFVGSPLTPQVLHTNNLLLRRIPLSPGWNWVSFNLDVPDKATGNVLGSLNHPQSGLIKSQTQFSQYSVPLSQWLGSLTQLGYKSMYQYQAAQVDTIDLVGKRIIPDTVNIPVSSGWNWISYLPNEAMQPDEALASLMPLNNDIIKGRTSFAQYVAGIGWVGNLDFMSPPNGYMLKISNPGVLVYPPDAMPGLPGNGFEELEQQELSDRSQSIWTVDPSQFEHSMNVVAVVGAGENLLDEGDAVGAFAGNQVRGGSEALWVEQLQSWLVFLTVYANGNGEELSFKYYDASAEDIHRLNERFDFSVNSVEGNVEQPLVLTLEGTTEAEEVTSEGYFEVYPNPARETVFVAFGMKSQQAVTVRIADGMGRLVREFEVDSTEGLNMLQWNTDGVIGGQYLVSLYSESGVQTKRVTVIR
jgi:hypothetical protein